MKTSIFILISISYVNARLFLNPVIPSLDNPDPGVVLYDGLYYAVTSTYDSNAPKFPIHVSSDLQKWNSVAYVFELDNLPKWSFGFHTSPQIFVLADDSFRVYFVAQVNGTDNIAIGVASSSNILGPYTAMDNPLMDAPNSLANPDPIILIENGSLFMILCDSENIILQPLSSDGLSILPGGSRIIFTIGDGWAAGYVDSPAIIKKGLYFYLFYTGYGYCYYQTAIGVARSRNLTGPYEKLSRPILETDQNFFAPGHCSVIKDIDGVSDVMVYHAHALGGVCNPRLMCSQSLGWDDSDWPFMAN